MTPLEIANPWRKLHPRCVMVIKRRRRAGESVAALAVDYGVGEATIRRALRRSGLAPGERTVMATNNYLKVTATNGGVVGLVFFDDRSEVEQKRALAEAKELKKEFEKGGPFNRARIVAWRLTGIIGTRMKDGVAGVVGELDQAWLAAS